ncbi:phage holin family protein [Blastococcus sp. TBT05-19]|uniref:phage holin family protein n=1 Tax=Blastococcus sp. TBT05-19 TaxID=2250581 RepID=UPI000DE8C3B9|nr:phage holin family protein [Blastococcus sp. TBT05-19]RBY94041.1 phage holin family protein [Blastococcus sp. TBT05-19]
MAHSVTTGRDDRSTGAAEPSIGTLVQSAMADVSTLVRSEIELAKTEITGSAKKAAIGGGAFGAAAVVLGFSSFFLFIAIAEALTALGLPRWVSYLIVWALLVVVAVIAALVGKKMIKKIEKPERTIESLRELPDVMHREAPGARHRDVPVVSGGKVELHGKQPYSV